MKQSRKPVKIRQKLRANAIRPYKKQEENMAKIYAALILKGLKTIDDVPL
jgi:hypothetical protein